MKTTALILCGGDSGRFWPLGNKFLLTFAGRSLLEDHVRVVKGAGVEKIIIIANRTSLPFIEQITSRLSFPVKTIIQTDPRGIAGAIISARKEIGKSPLFITSPSDVTEDGYVRDFLKRAPKDADVFIAVKRIGPGFPGGYVKSSDSLVTQIIEKPLQNEGAGDLVKLVFDYYKDPEKLINTLGKISGKDDDLYEQALNAYIKAGSTVKYDEYKGFWGFLKFPWDYLEVVRNSLIKISKGYGKNCRISSKATVSGKVFLGENVKISDFASVIGPCYIGKNTVIGNNVLIRESYIGQDCVIGFNSEVARSYLGDKVFLHSNYIGDSILMDETALGAGALTANYKLQGDSIVSKIEGKKINTGRIKLGAVIGRKVKIGVNTSIMPGVKIGQSARIGSNMLLDFDVPDNSLVYLKQKEIIKTEQE